MYLIACVAGYKGEGVGEEEKNIPSPPLYTPATQALYLLESSFLSSRPL